MQIQTEHFRQLEAFFSEKEIKKYSIKHLINLIEKCDKNSIVDTQLEASLLLAIDKLKDISQGNKESIKGYRQTLSSVKSHALKEYGFVEEGTYIEQYLALGLSIGTGVGVALSQSVGTTFLAVGIGVGLSIGAAFGSQKDQEMKDKDLTY